MPNPVAGFPDATNTGVSDGTKLTPYDGPMTITTPGTVIEGKEINGPIVVAAEDVVIKDCSIRFNSFWGIDAENAKNITVQNCDIVGPGTSGDSNSGILGSGTFTGNNISGVENGITLTDGSSTVRGNFIHDLADGGNDPHYDGISVQGRQDGVLIENNTIAGRDTSDVFIKNDFGAINDVTVHHNLLIGEPGYNVYVDGRADGGAITGVSITDNYVQEGFYGTYSVDEASPKISGNVEFAKGEAPSGPTASSPAPETTPDAPATGTSDVSNDAQNAESDAGTSSGGSQNAAPDTSTSGSDGQDSAPDNSTSGSGSQNTAPGSNHSESGSHHSSGDSFNWGHGHDHGGHSSGSYSHARHFVSDWFGDRADGSASGDQYASGEDVSWQDFHDQWMTNDHHWGADHFTL